MNQIQTWLQANTSIYEVTADSGRENRSKPHSTAPEVTISLS